MSNANATDMFTQILISNNTKLIGGILKNLLFQSEEMLENGIKQTYNQISDEKFFDFLRNAIYNDKVIAFKLMDKNNFTYDKKYFIELGEIWKAHNCIGYLKNI